MADQIMVVSGFACLAAFFAFKSEDRLNLKYDGIEGFIPSFLEQGLSYKVLRLPSEQYSDSNNPWFSGGVVISLWFP